MRPDAGAWESVFYGPFVLNYTESGAEGAGSDRTTSDRLSLELVTTVCGGGSCPTVYRTNRGTLVVQGYAVTAETAGVALPAGELLVEIPADLLAAAARAGGGAADDS